MSEHEMEPLDPELLALVAVERERPGMSADVQDRLLRRLGVSIAGGDGSGGGDGGAAPPGSAGTRVGRFFGGRFPFGVSAFVLGGLTGAWIHAVISRPASPPTVVAEPLPARVVAAAPPAAPAPDRPQMPVAEAKPAPAPARRPLRNPAPAAAVAVPVAVHESAEERDTELAAERALVETARAAMARGDALAALDTLERDARRFPQGRLVEERESLRILALARAGRYAEAKRLGATFREEFPGSLLLPVVDAALKSIP